MFTSRFLPHRVNLQQHDPSVPMPDPAFLRVHFQVAKILDVSGVGQRIKDACWESNNQVVAGLAPDGSTDVEHALNVKMLTHI